jgi:hypothetical protein
MLLLPLIVTMVGASEPISRQRGGGKLCECLMTFGTVYPGFGWFTEIGGTTACLVT